MKIAIEAYKIRGFDSFFSVVGIRRVRKIPLYFLAFFGRIRLTKEGQLKYDKGNWH